MQPLRREWNERREKHDETRSSLLSVPPAHSPFYLVALFGSRVHVTVDLLIKVAEEMEWFD